MKTTASILRTLSAKCRDCYRCVRVCPVKAIGIKNNQAYIDTDRCINCGTCVRECPQNAKVYRDDTEKVTSILKNNTVVASIAPSFSSIYDRALAKRLPSALRKLGFAHVSETSEGATIITNKAIELLSNPNNKAGICTACPVVVNYVEKYRPEFIDKLLPVVSPMIAHGKLLKQRYGDIKVVFIGPCIAKKQEAERSEFSGIIDAVLTFTELNNMLQEHEINLNNCPESDFDNAISLGHSKLFALPGGMLKTAGIVDDGIKNEVINISGANNIMNLFDVLNTNTDFTIVEPLFCDGGCINGPGLKSEKNIFQRRADLIEYANRKVKKPYQVEEKTQIDLLTEFNCGLNVNNDNITEQQIEEVYRLTDKANPEARLDCGACGYSSCREKAKAVIRGMAEIEMCMPYMRKLADLRTDKILERSPNGIVILDEEMRIITMNPAFCNYFSCGKALLGRKISYLLDAEEYEKVATKTLENSEVVVNRYGKKYQQIVYYIPTAKQYVGIYNDISGLKLTEEKLNNIKKQTVEQAQELLNHQIEMAMTMAKFLGENTAKGEALVERLMKIYEK
ncbi:4Fe-4S binding protein [Clostridium sp. 'deep sea']|uniref:[Fe-Fe] hydrogenase large subunit C-terminal domain-containing protein n=1 Tax=Clostridium sp. 'deep sea' TaxID=2779445 RepID=UPI0018966620|nr:[Fe-Fe] hydrogenase large subunit C-terminal domain-containing protein [Clostridium sp. 'deep sea']QOR34289.1 4Fe-4S binding protein [Clostridium sp. 'deep sea']